MSWWRVAGPLDEAEEKASGSFADQRREAKKGKGKEEDNGGDQTDQ